MGVGLKPTVSHDFTQIGAESGIWDKHDGQQVARLRGDILREGEGRVHDIAIEKVDVITIWVGGIVVKGEVTGEHCIKDDTARPNVDRRTNVHAIGYDKFGSCVTRRPTAGLHQFIRLVLEPIGESKIGDDNIAMSVEKEIL